MKTLLVEKLLENEQLRVLHDNLPCCLEQERLRLEKRRMDCEAIIWYLGDRVRDLNHKYDYYPEHEPEESSPIDGRIVGEEVRAMEDAVLLRYGSVLRYMCAAEADLLDLPLEACVAKLRLAQIEWRKRFGNTVIADSI